MPRQPQAPDASQERWQYVFSGKSAVVIRGLNAEALHRSLAFTGGHAVPAANSPKDPEIDVRFLPFGGEMQNALAALAPGERLTFQRPDGELSYYSDGFIVFRGDKSTIDVYLAPAEQCSMTGALGQSIFRVVARAGGLVLHAGAFEIGGLAFLAIGDSGSGKSAIAAAVLSAAGRVISDDLVLVCGAIEPKESEPPTIHASRPDAYFSIDTRHLLPTSLSSKVHPYMKAGRTKLRLLRSAAPQAFLSKTTPSCTVILSAEGRQKHTLCKLASQGEAIAAMISANGYLSQGVAPNADALIATALHLTTSRPVMKLTVGTRLINDPRAELADISEMLQREIRLHNNRH